MVGVSAQILQFHMRRIQKICTLVCIFIRNSIAWGYEWILRDEIQAFKAGEFSIVQKGISLFVLAEANIHSHDGLGQGKVRGKGMHFVC